MKLPSRFQRWYGDQISLHIFYLDNKSKFHFFDQHNYMHVIDKKDNNPEKTIKSLIKWLGWDWNNDYLYPHINQRPIFTSSDVQVRSPINSKSIGGWKNYEEILQPVFKIL